MSVNQARARAKEHLPSVVLTLLSIIQALALAAFWEQAISHFHQYPEVSLQGIVGWTQLVATFLTILTVWLTYVGFVIQFTWQPDLTDILAPFIIGVLELSFIQNLSLDSVGPWFCLGAVLNLSMFFLAHRMSVRARLDGDNTEFYSQVSKATWKDHLIGVSISLVFFTIGIWFSYSLQITWITFLAISIFIILRVRVILTANRIWKISMKEQPYKPIHPTTKASAD